MSYVRITIHLRGGDRRTGVRHFATDIALKDIKAHAWQLSVEVLGRGAIDHVEVEETCGRRDIDGIFREDVPGKIPMHLS